MESGLYKVAITVTPMKDDGGLDEDKDGEKQIWDILDVEESR